MRRASFRSRTGRPTPCQRRARRAKGRRWHVLEEHDKSCAAVEDRLRGEGPLTANELGGAKKGGPWWDWSETKIAAEWLLDIGELVCRRAAGLPTRLRPGRARHPARAPRAGVDRRAVRRAPGRRGRAFPRRGDGGRPGRVPRAAATVGPPRAAGHRPWSRSPWRGGGRPRSPIPPPSSRSACGHATGASSCPPSTHSSGTATGSSASSACATDSRPTRRRQSGPMATSPCRCWRGRSSSGWSTRAVVTTRSSPSR